MRLAPGTLARVGGAASQHAAKSTRATARAKRKQAGGKEISAAQAQSGEVGRAEEIAMKRVTTAIKESLEIGPTLIVWIIDRTPSARDMVREVTAAAAQLL